ncbi:F0F1 ATP synthase subunit delta [Zavarzinia sp. CC-PAN008]|uniref:F0F1 ATP synthase subunit delta n=1 Tax=Zavarzinia sp. CC-PAN008 TaxID=3243332 RepID=UPI003F7497B6
MPAESALLAGVATRYATALFELARDRRILGEVATELRELRGLIQGSHDLQRLLASPLYDRDQQGKALAAVLDRGGASDLVRNLVGLLARNRRLFVLDATIAAFLELAAKERGEVTARVVSAQPLSPQQEESLARALGQAAGRTVLIDSRVEPSLLGGMVVRLGSRQIDASLGTRLRSLAAAMKGA